MKKAILERELLTIVKQIEEDLSSPCSPQEMQWFIDQSLYKLSDIEKQLESLIQKKETAFRRCIIDVALIMCVGLIIFYTKMK